MKDDYDLSELEQITVRNLSYNIMPRYRYHYVDNSYEQFSLDLIDRLVTDGSAVVDVGAHYGIYSLLSAQKAKVVYAFEPVPENFQILQKNIAANNLTNVRAIQKAVSDKEEKVTFNIPWASDSAGFYDHPNAESIRKVQVQTAKLDNDLKDEHDVSFIKIDTEGHEIHVLEGLKSTLARNKKAKLLVEFNPECLANAGSKPEDLIKKIESLNYDIFAVHEDTRQMVRVDSKTPQQTILRGKTYLNFLCLQKDTWLSVILASHSSSLGGAELRLLEIVEMLCGYEELFILPYVILPAAGPLQEKLQKLAVSLEIVPMQGWLEHKDESADQLKQIHALNAEALTRLGQIFADFRPQLALTNSITIPWCALAARSLGVPHIWCINEFGDLDFGFNFDYGLEYSTRIVDKCSEAVLVNSKAVKKHFEKYIPAKKIKLVYQGIKEPSLNHPPKKEIYSSKAEIKLAVVGRVTPSKGQLDAVQALVELRAKGTKAELMILGTVGSKEYEQSIKDFASQNKVADYVHFVSHKDNPEDYLNLADIFIMSSRQEAYGRVTIEAMFLGKPVIGTNTGGTPELIEPGVSGFLYTPGDYAELAKQIQKLASKPALLAEMNESARKNAQKFAVNWDQFMEEIFTARKSTTEFLPIARDLLEGTAYLIRRNQTNQRIINEAHQKELADFSKQYNKVYEAYNELGQRFKEQHTSETNVGKLKHKLGHKLKRHRD